MKNAPVNDTPQQIRKMVHDRLMSLSCEERFVIGARMFESARRLVLASFPKGLSEEELKERLFERFYGRPLFPR